MARGSKPGERRGGRQPGTPNKANRELREVAKEYSSDALKTLHEICVKGESETARVAAANALLDRAHGKPPARVLGNLTHSQAGPHNAETLEETNAWLSDLLGESRNTAH